MQRGYDRVKRTLDIIGSAAALILLSPLIIGVAAAVALALGPPIFYTQTRPGRSAVPFRLVKFRSMQDPDEAAGILTDDERLTPFGGILRSTSLDELPELWNVLRGDMSFVGPRPLLMRYLDRYTPRQARRHEVRPGLTGLAQINGRNTVEWTRRFELDVEYCETRSFALDAKILWKTFTVVVWRQGTSAEGYATMPEFLGGSETRT